MGGRTFERKKQQLHLKKGVGVFSRVGLFSGDYGTAELPIVQQ